MTPESDPKAHPASTLGARWKRMRSQRITAWLIDLSLVALVFVGVTMWQQRGMLKPEAVAPSMLLTTLDGSDVRLDPAAAPQTLLYFFAPWCGVCDASIDNVEAIRQRTAADEVAIYVIALDWRDHEEVTAFLDKHTLNVPVLLGTPQVSHAYQIDAFPTYYVTDSAGRITHRSVGYSTEFGLRWRM